MKQHITVEQFLELSDEAQSKICAWAKDDLGTIWTWYSEDVKKWYEYAIGDDEDSRIVSFPSGKKEQAFPLLSIGQMIEFLSEHGYNLSIDQMDKAPKPWWRVCYIEMLIDDKDDLVDGLWEAVKGYLVPESE